MAEKSLCWKCVIRIHYNRDFHRCAHPGRKQKVRKEIRSAQKQRANSSWVRRRKLGKSKWRNRWRPPRYLCTGAVVTLVYKLHLAIIDANEQGYAQITDSVVPLALLWKAGFEEFEIQLHSSTQICRNGIWRLALKQRVFLYLQINVCCLFYDYFKD